MCEAIFPVEEGEGGVTLVGTCIKVLETEVGQAALSIFKRAIKWVENKFAEAKTYIDTVLGLNAGTISTSNQQTCTPEQILMDPKDRIAIGDCDANVAGDCDCTIETVAETATVTDDPNFAINDLSLSGRLETRIQDSTMCSGNAQLGVAGCTLAVTFFGKKYELNIGTMTLSNVPQQIVHLLKNKVFQFFGDIIKKVSGFFGEITNFFKEKYNAIKKSISPASLDAFGEKVMGKVRNLIGANQRAPFTLVVSGNGEHMWAFQGKWW